MDVLVESLEGKASWYLSFVEPKQGTSRGVLREVQRKMKTVHEDILARRLAAVRKTLDNLRLPPEAPAETQCLELLPQPAF